MTERAAEAPTAAAAVGETSAPVSAPANENVLAAVPLPTRRPKLTPKRPRVAKQAAAPATNLNPFGAFFGGQPAPPTASH
jgi:hypothetical protein